MGSNNRICNKLFYTENYAKNRLGKICWGGFALVYLFGLEQVKISQMLF